MARDSIHRRVASGLPANEEARKEIRLGIQRAFDGAMNPDGSLKPEAIKALFERYRIGIRPFAESLGVSDAYVHAVIARRKCVRRIEDAIAERLGFEPDRMWGRKPQGAPIRRRS